MSCQHAQAETMNLLLLPISNLWMGKNGFKQLSSLVYAHICNFIQFTMSLRRGAFTSHTVTHFLFLPNTIVSHQGRNVSFLSIQLDTHEFASSSCFNEQICLSSVDNRLHSAHLSISRFPSQSSPLFPCKEKVKLLSL